MHKMMQGLGFTRIFLTSSHKDVYRPWSKSWNITDLRKMSLPGFQTTSLQSAPHHNERDLTRTKSLKDCASYISKFAQCDNESGSTRTKCLQGCAICIKVRTVPQLERFDMHNALSGMQCYIQVCTAPPRE